VLLVAHTQEARAFHTTTLRAVKCCWLHTHKKRVKLILMYMTWQVQYGELSSAVGCIHTRSKSVPYYNPESCQVLLVAYTQETSQVNTDVYDLASTIRRAVKCCWLHTHKKRVKLILMHITWQIQYERQPYHPSL
jgi:hypothetical protein